LQYELESKIIVECGIHHLCKFGDIERIDDKFAASCGVTQEEKKAFWDVITPLHRTSHKVAEDFQSLAAFNICLQKGYDIKRSCDVVRANMLVFGDPAKEGAVKPIPYEMMDRAKFWLDTNRESGLGHHRTWNDLFWQRDAGRR
jgi:hypothetical protein